MTTVTTDTPTHPARWSSGVLQAIAGVSDRHGPFDWPVLDPFAGVGLPVLTACVEAEPGMVIGLELEPEWAEASGAMCVDSLTWLRNRHDDTLGGLVTSPCYGNRMADDHTPSKADTSDRITYRHRLGRPLSSGSAAGMQWGKEYRAFHRVIWSECYRCLAPGSLAVVNVANHIRGGVEQHVVEWHLAVWLDLGATVVEVVHVPTRKMAKGQNGKVRTDGERLLVVRVGP